MGLAKKHRTKYRIVFGQFHFRKVTWATTRQIQGKCVKKCIYFLSSCRIKTQFFRQMLGKLSLFVF